MIMPYVVLEALGFGLEGETIDATNEAEVLHVRPLCHLLSSQPTKRVEDDAKDYIHKDDLYDGEESEVKKVEVQVLICLVARRRRA